jgi:hypothetical protein
VTAHCYGTSFARPFDCSHFASPHLLASTASAWRLGHMWDGLAVAMDEVRIAVMIYQVPPPCVCVCVCVVLCVCLFISVIHCYYY